MLAELIVEIDKGVINKNWTRGFGNMADVGPIHRLLFKKKIYVRLVALKNCKMLLRK